MEAIPRLDRFDLEATLQRVEERMREVLRCDDPQLLEMASKMVYAGGKRIRPRITLLAFAACGARRLSEAVDAAAGIELIHTATLIHDDIIDGGYQRRGVAATYREYGLERAIIAGDFLFIRGFELAGNLDEHVVSMTAKACTKLAEGEVLELQCLRDLDLTVEKYIEIADRKTAAPIAAAAGIGAYLGGGNQAEIDALTTYGGRLGIAFQINDDLLDVYSDDGATGKPLGVDLRSGVLSMPSLLSLKNGHGRKLRAVLAKSVKTETEVLEAIAEIRASGAIEDARRMSKAYSEEALLSLNALQQSPYRDELARFAKVLANRDR
ncbi:MAG: polyprenyl synthetase family protein [Euryarchaeota archaeon]|nr:polyprenyl synthetase family protein [Euryarchaeota archaeon]